MIAIIGILSAAVLTSLQSVREDSKSARTAGDLATVYKAMLIMNVDTDRYPNNFNILCQPLNEISSTNEFAMSDVDAGQEGWMLWNAANRYTTGALKKTP